MKCTKLAFLVSKQKWNLNFFPKSKKSPYTVLKVTVRTPEAGSPGEAHAANVHLGSLPAWLLGGVVPGRPWGHILPLGRLCTTSGAKNEKPRQERRVGGSGVQPGPSSAGKESGGIRGPTRTKFSRKGEWGGQGSNQDSVQQERRVEGSGVQPGLSSAGKESGGIRGPTRTQFSRKGEWRDLRSNQD